MYKTLYICMHAPRIHSSFTSHLSLKYTHTTHPNDTLKFPNLSCPFFFLTPSPKRITSHFILMAQNLHLKPFETDLYIQMEITEHNFCLMVQYYRKTHLRSDLVIDSCGVVFIICQMLLSVLFK